MSLYNRLRIWFGKLFANSKKLEIPDALVKREYVLTGWDFGAAVSQITVGEKRNKDILLKAWEIAEKRYSDRGFRTIPLDDFIRYATLGVPLKGVGELREPDEIVVLHAPYYRLYDWKPRVHVHDLMTALRDEGYAPEDFSRTYARQLKQTS